MAVTDDIIDVMKSQAVKAFTDMAMKALTEKVWSGFAWPVLGPIAGYFVGLVIGVLATHTDWLAYMLIDGWKNTRQAKEFEQAVEQLEKLPEGASEEERKRLEQEQMDAFERLIRLGSAN